VAVVEDGIVVDLREEKSGLNHSKLLTVFVDELLKARQLIIADFDAVAVSEGPGSYTGLRIGVSVAKGICYAADLPLIAVSPLQAMAHRLIYDDSSFGFSSTETDLFIPMIDARRMEVYCGLYNSSVNVVDVVDAVIVDESTFTKELAESRVVFFGNGSQKCQSVITHPNALFVDGVDTSAVNMAEISHHKYVTGDFVNVAYFEPFYLKNFIATTPKKSILW
jgi:tRNA threonylcarbamoyladenosine biosynthesis protein TsaB